MEHGFGDVVFTANGFVEKVQGLCGLPCNLTLLETNLLPCFSRVIRVPRMIVHMTIIGQEQVVESISIRSRGNRAVALPAVEMPLADIPHPVPRIAQHMTKTRTNLFFVEQAAIVVEAVVV